MLRNALPIAMAAMLGIAVLCTATPASAAPIVAVLDSGADLRHRDLRGALWSNPGEIPRNRVDDDANGHVDDVHGVDLVSGDATPSDPRGHGTHVAGIVRRRARRADLMIVRVSDRDGRARTAALVEGIAYAAANGADVINVSLSYFPDRPAVERALASAERAGALVIAAAGNGGEDLDRSPSIPGGLDAPNLVTVAALGRSGRVASWSAHGSRTVQVAAPGVRIRSSLPGGRRGRQTGTSQAAAHASGTVARMLVREPSALGFQLRSALVEGSRGLRAVVGGAVRRARSVSALNDLLGRLPVTSAR